MLSLYMAKNSNIVFKWAEHSQKIKAELIAPVLKLTGIPFMAERVSADYIALIQELSYCNLAENYGE